MPRFSRKDGASDPDGLPSSERRKPSFVRPSLARPKESSRFRLEGSRSALGSTSNMDEADTDGRQNPYLRRLEEEAASYRRRIETYKQAQQQQAALVSRLQSKVMQYKQRCSELEGQMEDIETSRPTVTAAPGSALDAAQQHLREIRGETTDINTTLSQLDEEKRRSEKVMQINNILRQQLEEAHESNEALTADLQKLTSDWEVMREEMMVKEDEWKEEEQCFNDYYMNEHNRLIGLWRDVVTLKRNFTEMQSATYRDLTKMKSELSLSTRDMVNYCAVVETKNSFRSLAGEQNKQALATEFAQLKDLVNSLRQENESLLSQLRTKDDKVQNMSRDLHQLEERCAVAENGVTEVSKMQTELELLQSALRDIAHAVLQDAEGREPDTSHVHLTPPQPVPPRSPKRGGQRTTTSPAFAESTISAVQASLHKYQLQIHELQVKLQGSKEQLMVTRRQYDSSEEGRRSLESRMSELVTRLDSSKALVNQLSQEKNTLMNTLESVRMEKNALDKNRLEINAMLETVSSDYEKAHKANIKLQKQSESLEDEKLFLQNEVDRLNKEIEIREITLRNEEDRVSRLKEELLTTKEDLHKAYLAKELLEQQKAESDNLVQQIDKSRNDVEMELEQLLIEKSEVHETLEKTEHMAINLETEKKKLQDDIKQLIEEKASLQNQATDQNGDLDSLRKELIQAEQHKLDLESEKVSVQEKCKFLEVEKDKLELELGQVSRERTELSNQLSMAARKREGLAEELSRIRQRLEQANETNSRINRNLEDLVKECEDKQILVETNEKEIQRLQEQLASLRTDKDALEATLFDSQTNLETLDARRILLEREQQELLITQEGLRGEISRLKMDMENREKQSQEMKNSMQQQAGAMEGEYKQTIENLKKKSEDIIKKLTEEKEQVRNGLENRMQNALSGLSSEKDLEIQQLQDRISGLQQQIDNVCQQHEEVLLRAESDKQQALLIAHHDHQAVVDRLEELRREMEGEKASCERSKREAAMKAEQDRTVINQLRENLSVVSSKLEQLRIRAEEEKNNLEAHILEISKERDGEIQHSEELKLQLHLTEDKVDALQAQLQDTAHRLKEMENIRETLHKELIDVRRQFADASFEKEKYSSSNKELREHVKRVESQKREQSRALEEAQQKISVLDDNRKSLEMEKNRLQGTLRDLDRGGMESKQQINALNEDLTKAKDVINQKIAEEKQLQARMNSQSDERDRAQQQINQLGKQIMELENALEMAKQELIKMRNHGAEEENRWQERQTELLLRLEDSRNAERKLQDQSHNLEVCLADATQQIQELKARLAGSEGRVRALDGQLAQLDGSKREVEQKLSSIGSTLRRIAGIQLDGSVNLSNRLHSPTRRWGHVRPEHTEGSRGGDVILDVDPDAVRKGVRALMQQVAQVERERDDLKTQLVDSRRQLKEQTDTQNKTEAKLSSALLNLRQVQEEKGSMEARLGQKTAALQAQAEALQQKTEDTQALQEKLTNLELSLHSESEEKLQYEDKLEKMRQVFARSENEKRSLQDELSKTEARATKLELQRLGMEGDIQRLQMMLQERDSAVQKMQERIEGESNTITGLEERCASLKATVEQLNQTLERAGMAERDLHSEISSLQRTLANASSTSQDNAERLRQLQKSLANTENEKRVAVERLEATQQSLTEIRRSYQKMKEANAKLQGDIANCEVEKSGLESQLRMASWPNDTEELREQVAQLTVKTETQQDKIRQLETERRSLERKLHSARSKSYERSEKMREWDSGDLVGGSSSNIAMEQENKDLKAKIRILENHLAEKETELAYYKKEQSRSLTASGDIERYRLGQLQAERLLEAREESHRQQVLRLENQVELLKDQLNREVKRRQNYVLQSSKAGREVQELHKALGSSLRNVSQDPGLDSARLESETRRLDNTMATSPIALPLPRTPRT